MLVVSLQYDPDWAALAWAKEHCPSYITNNMNLLHDLEPAARAIKYTRRKQGGELVVNYYFGSEEDATLFALRWAS